jgi:hypothetical protein
MKASIKFTIGVLLIGLGLSLFNRDFFSVNAGIFFIVAGLFIIPPFWNLVKTSSPENLRSKDQIIVVSFNLFVGFCLFTQVLPGVGLTDSERAYAHTQTGQVPNRNTEVSVTERIVKITNQVIPAEIRENLKSNPSIR